MEPRTAHDYFLMQLVGGMIYHAIMTSWPNEEPARQPTLRSVAGQASRSSLEDWFARVDMLCADEAKGASWRDIV